MQSSPGASEPNPVASAPRASLYPSLHSYDKHSHRQSTSAAAPSLIVDELPAVTLAEGAVSGVMGVCPGVLAHGFRPGMTLSLRPSCLITTLTVTLTHQQKCKQSGTLTCRY